MRETRRTSKTHMGAKMSDGAVVQSLESQPSTPGPSTSDSSHNVRRKTIIKETLTRTASPSRLEQSGYIYVEDPWEVKRRTPKTDYTYATSGSYSPKNVEEPYITPNLSRVHIHRRSTSLRSSPTHAPPNFSSHAQTSMSTTVLSEHQSHYQQQQQQQMEQEQQWRQQKELLWQQQQERTRLEQETQSASMSMTSPPGPPRAASTSVRQSKRKLAESVTRSGTQFGLLKWLSWASSDEDRDRSHLSAVQEDERDEMERRRRSDLSLAEFRDIEKRLEYSGLATPYKEQSISHLYGLDQSDGETSDTESVDPGRMSDVSQTMVASTSFTSTVSSYFFALIELLWSIVMTSALLVTYPLRALYTALTTRHNTQEATGYDETDHFHSGGRWKTTTVTTTTTDVTEEDAGHSQQRSGIYGYLRSLPGLRRRKSAVVAGDMSESRLDRTDSGGVRLSTEQSGMDRASHHHDQLRETETGGVDDDDAQVQVTEETYVTRSSSRAGADYGELKEEDESQAQHGTITAAASAAGTVATAVATTRSGVTRATTRRARTDARKDEQHTDVTSTTREEHHALVEGEDEEGESYWDTCCQTLLVLLYLLTIGIPMGLFNTARRASHWVYRKIHSSITGFQRRKSVTVKSPKGWKNGARVASVTVRGPARGGSVALDSAEEEEEEQEVMVEEETKTDLKQKEVQDWSDSICGSCAHALVLLLYLVFVCLPIGVAKGCSHLGSWAYGTVLRPLAEVTRSWFSSFWHSVSKAPAKMWAVVAAYKASGRTSGSKGVAAAAGGTARGRGGASGGGTSAAGSAEETSSMAGASSGRGGAHGGGAYSGGSARTGAVYQRLSTDSEDFRNGDEAHMSFSHWLLSGLSRAFTGFFSAWPCACCGWLWTRMAWGLQACFTRVVLMDTWILASEGRRRRGCCCLLPLLFLLPLLLTGSYVLYEEHSEAITKASSPFWMFFSEKVIEKEVYVGGGGAGLSDEQLQARVRQIVLALYKEREVEAAAAQEADRQLILVQQQQVFNLYKAEVEQLVTSLVQEEASTLAAEANKAALLAATAAAAATAAKDDDGQDDVGAATAAALAAANQQYLQLQAQLTKLTEDQSAQLKGLNEKLLAVTLQAKDLEAALAAATLNLQSEDAKVRGESVILVQDLEAKLAALRDDIVQLQTAQAALLLQLKDCCKNDTALIALIRAGIQEHMAGVMAGVGGSGQGSTGGAGAAMGGGSSSDGTASGAHADDATPFALWLSSQFMKHGDMDDRLEALVAKLNNQIMMHSEAATAAAIAAAAKSAAQRDKEWELKMAALLADKEKAAAEGEGMTAAGATAGAGAGAGAGGHSGAGAFINMDSDDSSSYFSSSSSSAHNVYVNQNFTGITKEEVERLIREALFIFGADKTGMVDYALESAGGSVISTRCSETYHLRTAQLSLFGIPLWYTSNSARTVIQPEMQPGLCWAFQGSTGYLVVQLSGEVRPTAFSLEHIPKSLSPSGKIDSAPKDFSVYGLMHEKDQDGVLLGNFTYREDGDPLQSFIVLDPEVRGFPMVELIIHSNHGNPNYTCLYRFRVHGDLQRW